MSRKTRRNPRKLPAVQLSVRDPWWAAKIIAKEFVISIIIGSVVYFGTHSLANSVAVGLACFLVASGIKLWRSGSP